MKLYVEALCLPALYNSRRRLKLKALIDLFGCSPEGSDLQSCWGTNPIICACTCSIPTKYEPFLLAISFSGGGYLSNIPPSLFAARYERRLPDTIQGAEFLSKYGDHLDTVTSVDTEKTYAVKIPAAHPVHENFRVQAFRQALAAVGTLQSQQMEFLGELMLQSHGSYNACGLGSGGTDRLVALVLEEKAAAEAEGKVPGVFGAKITGGGCGGECQCQF
jgi:hypothetical protein